MLSAYCCYGCRQIKNAKRDGKIAAAKKCTRLYATNVNREREKINIRNRHNIEQLSLTQAPNENANANAKVRY